MICCCRFSGTPFRTRRCRPDPLPLPLPRCCSRPLRHCCCCSRESLDRESFFVFLLVLSSNFSPYDYARERLEFLLAAGVKGTDIRRILNRHPQILEYTVENNLKPHVVYLKSLGIPDSRIGQIITAAPAPSLFSYSIEQSLKPTIRYLIEEVGIKESCVSKVVQLSPQILVQRIDNSWSFRLHFLLKELGVPRDNIVKMVTKHPQVLHYSIEDGIQPRINFLRSIGM